jgi:hypothetical protein
MGSMFPPPDQALAYTLKDAARICGMSEALLYRAVKSGDLPAKRTSQRDPKEAPTGRILVLRSELENFLNNLPDDWWGLRYM